MLEYFTLSNTTREVGVTDARRRSKFRGTGAHSSTQKKIPSRSRDVNIYIALISGQPMHVGHWIGHWTAAARD